MVLFTKEAFLNLKTLSHMHINVQINQDFSTTPPQRNEAWSVYIQGTVADAPAHGEQFQIYLNAASKEDAYRIYNDISRQLVDSGAFPELTSALIDNVLKEN